ncbi:hypothetical protein HDV00_004320 [Rhizophlyctis rosea]|nr:hypothetical protein HDV00_004320 [Rhizophlyctis rosea]
MEDDTFVRAYAHLMENLVSAHAFYVAPVAKMLVEKLRWDSGASSSPLLRFERAHTMLRNILRLIPSGPSFILQLLTENFPHKREDLAAHIHYVRNIFQIIDYAPVLRNKILALVIDRVMDIDVDIQQELDELTDEEWEEVIRAIHHADAPLLDVAASRHTLPSQASLFDENGRPIDGSESDIDFDSDSDSDSDGAASIIEIQCVEVVQKLDGVLRFVFQYLKDFKQNKSEDELVDLFYVMMDIFDRTVLTTHRIKCAQFLWFYAASLHDAFPEHFIAFLLDCVRHDTRPDIFRISAAAYLGSFLARSRFVPLPLLRQSLEVLTDVAKRIVDANEGKVKDGDPEKYGVLYAVVQAELYVFCFHWERLMEKEDGTRIEKQYPPELRDFHKVLTSKFSPLKICSKHICEEFDRITTHLEIFNYYHYVDPSRNIAITITPPISRQPSVTRMIDPDSPNTSSPIPPIPSSAGLTTERLEVFFPFDPLPLPHSKAFIADLYNEWRGGGDENESDTSGVGGSFGDDPMVFEDLDRHMMAASLEDSMSISVSPSPYMGGGFGAYK